jgi:alkylation response protein AidB-like acyl-CoA dehydrogenase
MDPAHGLVELSGLPSGTVSVVEVSEPTWRSALARGRTALAHQIVGSCHTVLATACSYAGDRRQFGQAIGAFQAVKHRLAETLVDVVSADAAATAASNRPSAAAAAMAKLLAGRAADSTARHCLQVFGGIGFTTEHDFHRYFRRNAGLNQLLGDRRSLERHFGAELRHGRLKGERIVELDVHYRLELLPLPAI